MVELNKLYNYKSIAITIFYLGFISGISKFYSQGISCSGALPVSPGYFTSGTLTGIPTQPDATSSGWYSFTPSYSGLLNINSCGGGTDTRLWIWTGSCGSLTPVANNDDFAGCISLGPDEFASKIENVVLIVGNTYFFEWDNRWDVNGFDWNFSFGPLPYNNDAEIHYLTNRYNRIPISQATNGITLGGTIKNLSGNILSNVTLTSEIFELPNTTNPIATYTSPPVTLSVAGEQNLVSGVWAPNITISKSYLIKYYKNQSEQDQLPVNDTTHQNLILDYNYMARDNNNYFTSFNWSTSNGYSQGVTYSSLGPDQMTGVQYYIASTSTTQVYTVQVFSVTNGVVNTTPLYTSPNITNNGAGWKNHSFSSPLSVVAGDYLVAITKTGTFSFPIGCDQSLFTAGKNLIKVGTGSWDPMELYGASFTFMIRPKFGNDPVNDIVFISNLNPGVEYTKIHARQSLSGNTLQFSANGKNNGTATISNVTLTANLRDGQNNIIYSGSSAPQNLNAGQTSTFIVPSYNVQTIQNYTIEYIFSAATDQITQNNAHVTGFSRTKQSMSRNFGNNGSLGIGNNQTSGVYDNGILGQLFTLSSLDYLDSVEFRLNSGTPSGQPVRAEIYATSGGVPTGSLIASTTFYTTTTADNLNGITLKLPIAGGTITLTPGTYLIGVIENAGNMKLATSSNFYTPNRSYIKWDQNPFGSSTWTPIEQFNIFAAYVINPIFKTCLPILINDSITSASCGIADGNIYTDITGGTGTFTTQWSTGDSTENLTQIPNGIYSISVTDLNSCSVTQNYNVPSISDLSVTYNTLNANCENDANGQIILYPNLGVLPYSYAWSNNIVATDTASNLYAGIYTCAITDSTGCTVFIIDTIQEYSNINLVVLGNPVVCSPIATLDLQVEAQNGVGIYNYQWLGGIETTSTYNNAQIGNYTCIATDSLGCVDTVTIEVTLTDLNSSAVTNNILCNNNPLGSIAITTNGGMTPYSYAWVNSSSTNAILTGLLGGNYECIITDANGCHDTINATVIEPTPFAVSFITSPETLGNDGLISLTLSGATPPYNLLWDNGQTTEDISGLSGGIYGFTVIDANGCTYNDSVIVNSNVGLKENDGSESWTISPNPSGHMIQISGNEIGKLEIYDLNGKRILEFDVRHDIRLINIGNLENGVYIVQFENSSKRFIKQY